MRKILTCVLFYSRSLPFWAYTIKIDIGVPLTTLGIKSVHYQAQLIIIFKVSVQWQGTHFHCVCVSQPSTCRPFMFSVPFSLSAPRNFRSSLCLCEGQYLPLCDWFISLSMMLIHACCSIFEYFAFIYGWAVFQCICTHSTYCSLCFQPF